MVATRILLQERAEALESLTHTLASLDGADADAIHEAAERARVSRDQDRQDYMTTKYLAEMAQVLRAQQRRIRSLEQRVAKPGKSKRSS